MRMDVVSDGVIFRGQTEGVPPHRMQDIVTAHPVEAGVHTGGHIVAAMADRQAVARRIGEEVQDIVVRLGRIMTGGIQVRLLPIGRHLASAAAKSYLS